MPNNTQQLIEEAVGRLEEKLKPLYKSGSFDVFNLKVAIEEELSTIASKSAEKLEEEVMMLFVDVDAGGQVTEKETITINDVRKLFESPKQHTTEEVE